MCALAPPNQSSSQHSRHKIFHTPRIAVADDQQRATEDSISSGAQLLLAETLGEAMGKAGEETASPVYACTHGSPPPVVTVQKPRMQGASIEYDSVKLDGVWQEAHWTGRDGWNREKEPGKGVAGSPAFGVCTWWGAGWILGLQRSSGLEIVTGGRLVLQLLTPDAIGTMQGL